MKAKTPVKKTIENEQIDKDGNLVCPTCKKPLRGLRTNVSDSINESETLVRKPLSGFLHVGQTKFPSLSICSFSIVFLTGVFAFILTILPQFLLNLYFL